MRDMRFILLLLAFTALLFFFGLNDTALTDPDETFYAETAKEMFNANEWITPYIFGKPQFEKPILYYWLVIIGYMIFGISEFAARFCSVIFGILGVIGVYFLGRLLFSRLCGFLSGLIIATCVQYIVLARACVTDMCLMVFILFTLLFFLLGWTTDKKYHYITASITAALAVLTKGPIGVFIPLIIIFLYVLFSRQWKNLKSIPTVWCILVFMIVCLPWYIAVIRIHGTTFINDFFGFQNVTRFLVPEHRIGDSPFYYIPVTIVGFCPWSLFLALGTWDMYKNAKCKMQNAKLACPPKLEERRREIRNPKFKKTGLFLLVWFLMVFLFFSISRTKLVTYIFPLYPVMAIVTGRFWERFIGDVRQSSATRKYMSIAYSGLIVFVFLAFIGTSLFVNHRYTQALSGTIVAESVFSIGLLLSLLLFLRRKKFPAFIAIVLTVLVFSVPLVKFILPVMENFESSKTLSLEVKRLAGPGEAIGGEGDHARGVAFYTGRTDIEDIHWYPGLKHFVMRKERVWCILQRKHYQQLIAELGDDIVSRPLSEVGKYVLVTNKPLKDK